MSSGSQIPGTPNWFLPELRPFTPPEPLGTTPDLTEGRHCSDHGCVFGHPGGQGTNGGCRCLGLPSHELRRRIKDLAERCQKAEAEAENEEYDAANTGLMHDLERAEAKAQEAEDERDALKAERETWAQAGIATAKQRDALRKEIRACTERTDEPCPPYADCGTHCRPSYHDGFEGDWRA